MANGSAIHTLVLQELRLRDTTDPAAAARAVQAAHSGQGPAVPLLWSIDDARDVAVVGAVYAGDTAPTDTEQRARLEPYVATWRPPQRYIPRITERSSGTPAHYRLAVTGSGINNAASDPRAASDELDGAATGTPLDLLWIGVPLGTYAGLFILVGTAEQPARPDANEWPLPLSRSLGVRIYDSRR